MSSNTKPHRDDELFLDEEHLELLGASLAPVRAPEHLLARIQAHARHEGRLAQFCAATAELLDLPRADAQALLDRLAEKGVWEPGFVPGMELCHVKGGPKVAGAITGFVRLKAGFSFPDHEHIGAESVLILQGRCEEDGRIFTPGERVDMPAGSRHAFRVCAGPDLVYLAVVQEGLRVGELVFDARDPRA